MTTIDSSTQAFPGDERSGEEQNPSVDGLSVELAAGVLSITMNRPDSLNSLTKAMLAGIADAVERAGSDERVRVVRLSGAGRAFSSGAGISEEDQKTSRAGSPADVIDEANRAVRAIVALPKPAVAVVHGPAAGVAASLAIACDVVLASETAFFMLAFTKIALMPDGGASALVAAAVGRIRAMRMALLAERIPARDALEWGLVTAVHPAESFEAEVDKVVATLVRGPAVAFRKTKDAINAATLTELDAALEREKEGQSALIRSNDFREGALAFQQRRSPTFTDD
jgi:enoyl-CoA hydratase